MSCEKDKSDDAVVATLFARIHWRDGALITRLNIVIAECKRREGLNVNYVDPEFERLIRKRAKKLRKYLRGTMPPALLARTDKVKKR